MKSRQILFFSLASDIQPIIKSIESEYQIKYYEMGMFDTSTDTFFNSISEIPDLGMPKTGDWNRDLRLMIIPKQLVLKIREVSQRNGGLKFAIDPLENQVSVCCQFGGVYQDGVLLGGSFGSSFLNDFSLQILKSFLSKLKKEFKKIGTFYVSKTAEENLKKGWRLVTNVKSPKEYDLAFS